MKKLIIIAITVVLIISVITYILPEKEIKLPTATGEAIQEKSDKLVEDVIDNTREKIIDEIEEKIEKTRTFTLKEFSTHNMPQDCWITYENKIYNYTNADIHPNMKTAFYSHCGETTFESAAKARHSSSSEYRVYNFGDFIGTLEINN